MDRVVLATWHEALSSALGMDVPHDLLGLWLYPAAGGSVLLGPEALAEDRLRIPLPRPHVPQDQLYILEEIVREAGYGSAVCVPIPFGQSDVGLMLLADLRPAVYGPRQAVMLQEVAHRLGPAFARIARRWSPEGDGVTGDRARAEAAQLVDRIAEALETAESPRELAHALYAALQPLVPHERAELIVPGGPAEEWYRFGEHAHGALWSDRALVVSREDVDIAALFDGDRLLAGDTRRDSRWAGWPGGTRLFRSAIGVRLGGGRGSGHARERERERDRGIGWLVLGSAGPDLYHPTDLEVLHRAAALIAPRVEGFVLDWHLQSLRGHLGTVRNAPTHLGRIAELMATSAHPADATRLLANETAAVLPFDRLRFALRLGDEQRVVVLEPGESRSLLDLPLTPVAGTAVGQVVRGELPGAFVSRDGEAELVVPLRVAGKIIGAMVLTVAGADAYGREDLALAQQIADAVAPHLELLRRAAVVLPPFMPTWRRVPSF